MRFHELQTVTFIFEKRFHDLQTVVTFISERRFHDLQTVKIFFERRFFFQNTNGKNDIQNAFS